jgi:hypothetical protein
MFLKQTIFFAIYDRFPVSLGYLLISSKALKMDYFNKDDLENKRSI